jgi:hypothetical protein
VRLPFPERISLLYVVLFATLLFAVQLVEGTSLLFAICSCLFVTIAAVAFNLAGGLTRPSGAYIFFYSVLGLIIGLIWKAILGEAADSNLTVPLVTIQVYLGGICAMLAAVFISRRLALKRAILRNLLTDANMQNATIGCMVTGGALTLLLLFPVPGTVYGTISQLNRFLFLAVLLGVTHQIKKTGGTSSVSLPVLISFLIMFCNGVFGFSKEGMITPLLCWAIAASSMRYRVSLIQIVGGVLATFFIFHYLVPYSQYGRNYKTDSASENLSTSISMLSNLGYVREQYLEIEAASVEDHSLSYFNTPQGFFERLQMIGMDDKLINITEQGQVYGLYPIVAYFENLVPHFFWPNKPRLNFNTMYAQEIGGVIPEDDMTTGISFTPTAEGFHLARWTGLFLVAPILWIMLFTLFDSLCGDARKAPWGLLAIMLFAHAAPESGLGGGVVYMLGFGAFIIIFAAYTCAYLMPIVGTLVVGPEKPTIRPHGGPLTAVPARIPNRIRPQSSSTW